MHNLNYYYYKGIVILSLFSVMNTFFIHETNSGDVASIYFVWPYITLQPDTQM